MFFLKPKNKVIAWQSTHLKLAPSNIHGKGVFCKSNIRKGELIEAAPILAGSLDDYHLLRHTNLHEYYFLIDNKETPMAIGLGFSSWYNHACPANAKYKINLKKRMIEITAVKVILKDSEITINYHGTPDDNAEIIFNR